MNSTEEQTRLYIQQAKTEGKVGTKEAKERWELLFFLISEDIS